MSEGEIDDSDDEINRCNLEEIRKSKKSKQVDANIDADSDFSIDDDSSDEENDKSKKDDEEKPPNKKDTIKQDTSSEQEVKPVKSDEKNEQVKNTLDVPVVKKIDIWKKRTVGEVFEQALKRYYERKANRGF
ncbi:hypothetical protein RR48_10318 [Papilio machaon]|uniref:Uncharacterized protein n=1 Tax=Papilio machaon TaxID=76193 RepID=A0A194RH01_PAPMA|nr:hypothetical protein RR48_10318 [Papilio machaon]